LANHADDLRGKSLARLQTSESRIEGRLQRVADFGPTLILDALSQRCKAVPSWLSRLPQNLGSRKPSRGYSCSQQRIRQWAQTFGCGSFANSTQQSSAERCCMMQQPEREAWRWPVLEEDISTSRYNPRTQICIAN
jgi:hypothetical protein